ncbi:unnamed protein product [Effrenium voratum]|uniref:Ubiquitin-like domain-containing protein n=1 Tax=Effrenium voratum TaxID=2562239 RepID=A0AA36IDD0_9DINO|nr:unnamed protein product [Effrenium voratum]
MPVFQVQPIAASLPVEVEVAGGTIADLKAALANKTGVKEDEQRLVTRGRLLEDSTLLESVDGRIFLARASCVSFEPVEPKDEIQLRLKTIGGMQNELRLTVKRSLPAREFKQQALLRLGKPAEIGYKFVASGQLMSSEATLAELGLQDGDVVVVVAPRAPFHVRVARQVRFAICWLLGGLWSLLKAVVCALGVLPGTMLRWLINAWYDPWSLVRPTSPEVRGRRIQTLGFSPQMLRYAPGQNPRGEDLTVLLSQGLIGM